MKMNTLKKLVCLVLSLAMLFALAACGGTTDEDGDTGNDSSTGNNDSSTGNNDSSTGNNDSSTGNDTEEEVDELEGIDFGGRVFKIGSYYDMTPDPSESALKEALANRIAEVEEKCNCTIEFVQIDGDYMSEYVTSVLAGDPIVDIGYVVTYRLLPSLIEGGIAYPLSQCEALDLSEYKWRSDVTEAGTYKGEQYMMLMKDPEIRYGIFWNKTLFDRYGLPDLYELVENDEWTWEKFKEVAQQGNILDSDGNISIYGFNARESLAWCYIYSNGADVATKTDSGLEVDLSDSKVMEALTALQDFTTNVTYRGSIDWSTESWDSFITDFRDGKYMMCLEEFWISYSYLNDEDTGMSDEWGWVPFPKGPSATDWSCYGKEFGARFILNGVEDPDQVALMYDLITDIADTDEEWDELLEDRLENWCDDQETVELVSYITSQGLSMIDTIKGFSDLNSAVNSMFDAVSNGSMTPATALETYQSQIDKAVEDLKDYDYEAELIDTYVTDEDAG